MTQIYNYECISGKSNKFYTIIYDTDTKEAYTNYGSNDVGKKGRSFYFKDFDVEQCKKDRSKHGYKLIFGGMPVNTNNTLDTFRQVYNKVIQLNDALIKVKEIKFQLLKYGYITQRQMIEANKLIHWPYNQ